MASRCRRRASAAGSSASAWSKRWRRSCRTRAATSMPRLTETYKANFFRARGRGPGRGAAVRRHRRAARRAGGGRLAARASRPASRDRGLGHCLECHGIARALRLAADRRPPPVQAAPVDGAAGDGRRRRRAGNDRRHRRHRLDMGMARAAGATGIGAGWGYHEADELLAGGAAAVADEPAEVLELIAERTEQDSMTDEDRVEAAVPALHADPAVRPRDLPARHRDRLHRPAARGRLAGWSARSSRSSARSTPCSRRGILKKHWEREDRDR